MITARVGRQIIIPQLAACHQQQILACAVGMCFGLLGCSPHPTYSSGSYGEARTAQCHKQPITLHARLPNSFHTMANPSNRHTQLVGVIGPAGFGGSYLTAELIRRGHTVVGISRNPQSFGIHDKYRPRPLDIEESTVTQLADAFRDLDTLVSEYGPHTQGADALQYSTEAIHRPVISPLTALSRSDIYSS